MIRRSLGLLAVTAAFALFGGLHLEIASGRAIDRQVPNDARLQTGTTLALTGVNRPSKRDRAEISSSPAEGHTITFQHPDLPATTVALRLAEAVGAGRSRPVPTKGKKAPGDRRKQAVACEVVVSGLTEVAKQLDAGRCVT